MAVRADVSERGQVVEKPDSGFLQQQRISEFDGCSLAYDYLDVQAVGCVDDNRVHHFVGEALVPGSDAVRRVRCAVG